MNTSATGKRPVIVGIGQEVNRPKDLHEIKRPIDLIEDAIRNAENDSGVKNLAEMVDTLCLVNILSWPYDNPLPELASRIDATPNSRSYSWVGATAPQWFVNRTADRIHAGQANLALICGGETFCSTKFEAEVKEKDFRLWNITPPQKWMAGDLRDPLTPLEMKYGLMFPINIYPLFENALRHHHSLTMEEHRKELGEFCSRFSAIASRNPYAWFREQKTPDEITIPTKTNRMISFPYTKAMCSMMVVDQAAALFLTDAQTARELGIPEEKWVYLLGSGDASDIWHVTERVDFCSSPSVKVAADKALEQAGVSLPQIDYWDFYSCFPSATRVVQNTLGIPNTDPRPLTITGGMPYFGGPGNNYGMHSICGMVDLLRRNPDKIGLVHALSWYISKHTIGIYSGLPGRNPREPIPPDSYQKELDKLKGPELAHDASGNAIVETYTLFHDSEGDPTQALVIGRMDDGRRFIAKVEPAERGLAPMMESECIGTRGRVSSRDGINIFRFQ